MGVVHGVHGNTTSPGPVVALDGELVLGTRSLHERLVGTTTTSDDADHATGTGGDDLLGTGGELDAGLALVGVVADNGDVVAGGAAQSATVTDPLLDVGDDGTLGHLTERQDVADGQGSLLSGVDELAGVHALVGDESLGDLPELVGVTEDDLGEGSTATCDYPSSVLALLAFSIPSATEGVLTGIVDDLADDTSEVSVSLGVIQATELGRSLVEAGAGSYRKSVSALIRSSVASVDDAVGGVGRTD